MNKKNNNVLPAISVIMPVYNGSLHLKEAVDSIIHQTFTNWELLVINEYGSEDGSADLINEYTRKDPRIVLVQNNSLLGLAESLNKGILMARGRYIARMDSDDFSYPTRFEKQIKFLDQNLDVGLCGTYQHHFGEHTDWIHMPPSLPEECKANLLFDCDLCHSTVMFRRELFIENNLFYDKNYLAEDFELWSRAVGRIKIANIPEVLGEYRWNGLNISVQKLEQMAKENAVIVAKALKEHLKIIVAEEDHLLLEGWRNPFFDEKDRKVRKQMYCRFQKLLMKIYGENELCGFYERKALLNIIASKWRYARYMEPRNEKRDVNSLQEIFNPYYIPNFYLIWKANKTHITSVRDLVQKIWKYFTRNWTK